MELEMKEQMAELLISKTQSIPDHVQKAFIRRAVEDARGLLQNKNDLALDKLAYTIYRAYTLGAALYDGDNLITKFEEIEQTEKEVVAAGDVDETNSKVVSLNSRRA